MTSIIRESRAKRLWIDPLVPACPEVRGAEDDRSAVIGDDRWVCDKYRRTVFRSNSVSNGFVT
jgi:hypothetical protein